MDARTFVSSYAQFRRLRFSIVQSIDMARTRAKVVSLIAERERRDVAAARAKQPLRLVK